MKSPRAALVATAIPLLLTSLRANAGELPFNTPTSEQAHSASLDRSAFIGTGYAAHAETTNSPRGVPASPHWTASIGTGTAATSVTAAADTKHPSSTRARPVVAAAADWTSRIGRGDASDSNGLAHSSLATAR
jgi:hypothetical protein